MPPRPYPIVACALLLLGGLACRPDAATAPDVSGIELELDVRRFDWDLHRAAADSTHDGAAALRDAYPVFFDSVWLRLMIPGGDTRYDSALVRAFAREPALAHLLDTVTAVYPQTPAPAWVAEIEQGFRYARHYFPETPTPTVIAYVSEVALGALTYGRDVLGVGLDFFLGADYAGYDRETFPAYVRRAMTPAHIAPRAIEAWVTHQLPPARQARMLDQMLANGRVLYVKQRLLPHVADTAVLGFSTEQLAWLHDNETQMWTHYLDEKLLYETSPRRIGKHVGVSPNVPGMPPEAPGGGANWVGLRIVEAYMRRHPATTLPELLALEDAQALLTESKYRPGFED